MPFPFIAAIGAGISALSSINTGPPKPPLTIDQTTDIFKGLSVEKFMEVMNKSDNPLGFLKLCLASTNAEVYLDKLQQAKAKGIKISNEIWNEAFGTSQSSITGNKSNFIDVQGGGGVVFGAGTGSNNMLMYVLGGFGFLAFITYLIFGRGKSRR